MLELDAQPTWQAIMSSGITRLSAVELLRQKNPENILSNAVQEYAVLCEQLIDMQHDIAVYQLKIERLLSQPAPLLPKGKQESAAKVEGTSQSAGEKEKMRLLQEEARVSSERRKEIYQELLTVQ